MNSPRGLRTFAEVVPGVDPHRAVEQRLRRAWTQILGPAMAQRTCLLSARKGLLVAGCWDPAYLSGLRQSALATWPELQARILRMTGLRFHSVQLDPCDPPSSPAKPAAAQDPLAAVLHRYRHLAKDPFTSSQD